MPNSLTDVAFNVLIRSDDIGLCLHRLPGDPDALHAALARRDDHLILTRQAGQEIVLRPDAETLEQIMARTEIVVIETPKAGGEPMVWVARIQQKN